MKTIATIMLAVLISACAGKPARPQTQSERECEYDAQRAMAGQFGASPFEAAALYRKCLAAKGGAL